MSEDVSENHLSHEEIYKAYTLELEGAQAKVVMKHLKKCDVCQVTLNGFLTTDTHYSQKILASPQKTTAEEIIKKAKSFRDEGRFIFILKPAALVAVLAVFVVGGLIYGFGLNRSFKNEVAKHDAELTQKALSGTLVQSSVGKKYRNVSPGLSIGGTAQLPLHEDHVLSPDQVIDDVTSPLIDSVNRGNP